MTETEIESQVDRLMVSFPTLGTWYQKLSDDQRTGLVDAWKRQLGACNAADVTAVVDSFVDGDLDLPPNYEFDRTAIIIKREARKRTRSRRNASLVVSDRNIPEPTSAMQRHAQDLVRGIRKAMDAGCLCREGEITREENQRRLEAILENTPAPPEECQPRYRCLDCEDRGRVTFEHEYTAKDASNDKPIPAWMVGKKRMVVGACNCAAGNIYRRSQENPKGLKSPAWLAISNDPQYHSEFSEWDT